MAEMTALRIETIGVCLKPEQPDAKEVVGRLISWAARHDIEVVVEAANAGDIEAPTADREALCERADLVVAVGGDGTLLSVVRACGTRSVPILGINLGTLGFLTEVNRDEMEAVLDRLRAGEIVIESRMRLDIEVERDGDVIARYLALNDVVITRTALSRMVDLRTFADGLKVTTYHGDGLIISTPTGSTAYSLSAAGPIALPLLEAFLLTPICPHALNQRPIVLPHQTEVEVRMALTPGAEAATMTVDGQDGLELGAHDSVVVRRSPHDARIVTSPFRNRFEILHTKLNWGER
ncbi:MAG: NAD(+)/NADH kinase [Myxococcota bacterium]|jgi:NAD+ kinase|nr:NAD(+)/NADH kinase [Myxococcota bacterium]